MEIARRVDSLDGELEQRAMHARDRLRAVGAQTISLASIGS
jgi:hypothetical protein